MMQTAELGNRNDLALAGGLNFARRWRVAIEGKVRAYIVVVIEIQSQNSLEVKFVQDDHVVQAFPANGADHALRVSILPR